MGLVLFGGTVCVSLKTAARQIYRAFVRPMAEGQMFRRAAAAPH
jgi:hypothetical protein